MLSIFNPEAERLCFACIANYPMITERVLPAKYFRNWADT